MTEQEMYDCLKIDEFNLDEKWRTYPAKYMSLCDALNDQRLQVEELRHKFDLLKSGKSLDVKDDPTKYGFKRATEATVDAIVEQQPDIMRMKEEIRLATYVMKKYQSLVDAMDSKKKALENLVHLASMQYYSEPTAKAGTSPLVGKKIREKSVNERIREEMKKGDNE